MTGKLVIFDLDGTLLNTIEDLGHAVNGALEKNGFPTHPIGEYCRMVGNGVRNLVRRAMPDPLKEDEGALGPVLEDFFVFYRASIDRFTRPYPGIEQLLQRLQSEGYLLAVASNKFQDGTSALIRNFFPDIGFISVLGSRPDSPLKPDPDIINDIIRTCGKDVDALMVGDSGTDIATARAANIPVIAVSWGFRAREELSEADAIADDADGLYNAINSI